MTTHHRWDDIPAEPMNPLIDRQYITTPTTMLARIVLKRGAHVPLHRHHNEQISYILSGALKFIVDGTETIVRAGEVLCIPPHAPHEAIALEDTLDLDLFNPPRQDWIDKDDAYLRQG